MRDAIDDHRIAARLRHLDRPQLHVLRAHLRHVERIDPVDERTGEGVLHPEQHANGLHRDSAYSVCKADDCRGLMADGWWPLMGGMPPPSAASQASRASTQSPTRADCVGSLCGGAARKTI